MYLTLRKNHGVLLLVLQIHTHIPYLLIFDEYEESNRLFAVNTYFDLTNENLEVENALLSMPGYKSTKRWLLCMYVCTATYSYALPCKYE